MLITRKSLLTGITRTLEVPITEEQLNSYEKGQDLIQNIMPNLDSNLREFIMTGVTEEEWDNLYKEEDNE